jgi:hypothetical protein
LTDDEGDSTSCRFVDHNIQLTKQLVTPHYHGPELSEDDSYEMLTWGSFSLTALSHNRPWSGLCAGISW